MSIGQQIKKLRNALGLTQIQLAQKANISRSYLGDIEGDRYNPSVETLRAISNVLNVDVSILLSDKEKDTNINLDDIQYALYGEVKELSDEDKKKILEFARYVKEQSKNK